MKNWLECQSEEWMVCRFFLRLYPVDKGYDYPSDISWKDMKIPSIQALLMFFTGIIGEKLFNEIWMVRILFSALIFVAFPILIFRYFRKSIKHASKVDGQVTLPAPDTRIPYLLIRNDGIQVNTYPPLHEGSSPFISWGSVKSLRLGRLLSPYELMQDRKGQFDFPNRIQRYAEKVSAQFPSINVKQLSEYKSRLALFVNQSHSISQIPLPSEWQNESDIRLLLLALESNSGLTVSIDKEVTATIEATG